MSNRSLQHEGHQRSWPDPIQWNGGAGNQSGLGCLGSGKGKDSLSSKQHETGLYQHLTHDNCTRLFNFIFKTYIKSVGQVFYPYFY